MMQSSLSKISYILEKNQLILGEKSADFLWFYKRRISSTLARTIYQTNCGELIDLLPAWIVRLSPVAHT